MNPFLENLYVRFLIIFNLIFLCSEYLFKLYLFLYILSSLLIQTNFMLLLLLLASVFYS